jgi:glycosyltransferase involved in cell wall biosynthesis
MKLAFHYHIPVTTENGTIKMPSYQGLFVDSLTTHFESVNCLLFQPLESEKNLLDYNCNTEKVKIIDLGMHDSVPKRLLRFFDAKAKFEQALKENDVLILRSPTPYLILVPFLKNNHKIAFYIVGDSLEGAKALKLPFLKRKLVEWYMKFNHWLLHSITKNRFVIVNSHQLYLDFKEKASKIYELKSTTLSDKDFFEREDTCNAEKIKVVFTGRLDPGKGIEEIMIACNILKNEGFNIHFYVAGLLIKGLENFPNELNEKAQKIGFAENFHYLGKKDKDGLNELYQQSDIYALASRSNFEGFPRTIWEAMGASLPVVATSVSSIPYFLKNNEDALLIEPNNIQELTNALKKVITDADFRKKLIRNGYAIAKTNTLEIQSKKMFDILNENFGHE